MTEADFKRLAAEGYNRVPLVPETFADLDTPLSIYLKPDTIYLRPDTLGCPDLLLLLSEEIAVLDKLTGKLHLVVFAGLPSPFAATRYHALATELLADSDADSEWQETQNKARALFRAAELAAGGLGNGASR